MSVYKKGNKYYCRFQINGERHNLLCHGATNKKEAEQVENAFKYKIQQQQNGIIPKDRKSISFGKLMNMYLEYSKLNKKSWETDKSRVKYILKFFQESKSITKIKAENIEDFKAWLITRDISKTTVNRYLELLSKAFNIAIDNNYLSVSPMKNVNKFPVKNYTVRYLKKDEEERLFEVLPEHLKGIVLVALKTGLRKNNILNLKWEQINFDYKFIEILENKGNKHIIIPMNNTLYEYLNSLEQTNEYVFINPETNMPYTDIRKAWNNALEKAGIENFRFHDLRHTVGTRLIEQGIPINIIKELLAHSDIKTTMRYLHYGEDAKRDALNKL